MVGCLGVRDVLPISGKHNQFRGLRMMINNAEEKFLD